MDRDAIERRDFPTGRRGYDQAAVDEHLRRVADEIEALRSRPTAAPGASLSTGTSEHVRVILEAAEASAAELRADAGRQASDHVAEVRQATSGMLSRLDELEHELGNLLDALRAGGERLNEGLARLHVQAGELGGGAAEPAEPSAKEARTGAEAGAGAEAGPGAEAGAGAKAGAGAEAGPGAEAGAGAEPPSRDGDEAGARLIALNMALSGAPREETARYLAENFGLADAEALLDDVYERAGE